jgi:hypothetical protein
MLQIHSGVATDFQAYLDSNHAGRQRYYQDEEGKLRRRFNPPPVDRQGKKKGQDARMNYGERITGTIPDPIIYSVLKR